MSRKESGALLRPKHRARNKRPATVSGGAHVLSPDGTVGLQVSMTHARVLIVSVPDTCVPVLETERRSRVETTRSRPRARRAETSSAIARSGHLRAT